MVLSGRFARELYCFHDDERIRKVVRIEETVEMITLPSLGGHLNAWLRQ